MLEDVRCGRCGRKLAAVSGYRELQIKCPRCGVLNHLKAASLPPECPMSIDPDESKDATNHREPVRGHRGL